MFKFYWREIKKKERKKRKERKKDDSTCYSPFFSTLSFPSRQTSSFRNATLPYVDDDEFNSALVVAATQTGRIGKTPRNWLDDGMFSLHSSLETHGSEQ